jgi:hypothetical protein
MIWLRRGPWQIMSEPYRIWTRLEIIQFASLSFVRPEHQGLEGRSPSFHSEELSNLRVEKQGFAAKETA